MNRKKIAAVLAAALVVSGLLAAQAATPAPAQAQVTKISGKLELVQGMAAIELGGKTYLLPEVMRLAGFIKGAQEGDTVSIEGYAYPLPYDSNLLLLRATKLTVEGKDYDLGQTGKGPMGRGGFGMMKGPGMMGGAWGGRR
jgi:hypothetical protein